jgi:hypothetical protein
MIIIAVVVALALGIDAMIGPGRIQQPKLGAMVDAFQCPLQPGGQFGADPNHQIRRVQGPRLTWSQLKVMRACAAGQQHLRLPEIAHDLRDKGTNRWDIAHDFRNLRLRGCSKGSYGKRR